MTEKNELDQGLEVVRRGYDPHQVKRLVGSLSDELKAMTEENESLRGRVGELEKLAAEPRPAPNEDVISVWSRETNELLDTARLNVARVMERTNAEAADIVAAAEQNAADVREKAAADAAATDKAAATRANEIVADADERAAAIRNEAKRTAAATIADADEAAASTIKDSERRALATVTKADQQAAAAVAAAEGHAAKLVAEAEAHANKLVGDATRQSKKLVADTDAYAQRVTAAADNHRLKAEDEAQMTTAAAQARLDQIAAQRQETKRHLATLEAQRKAIREQFRVTRAQLDELIKSADNPSSASVDDIDE